VAVTLTVVTVVTTVVATVNIADVLPAGTTTEDGTWAAVLLLLDRLTVAPFAGAAPVSTTVPVELLPPGTDVGFSVTLDTTGGLMVRVAFAVAL
jgi:hypothetical protein